MSNLGDNMGKGMTPRKGYNAKKYREGFDFWKNAENKREKSFGREVAMLSCFMCNGRGEVTSLEHEGEKEVCEVCKGKKEFPPDEWKKLLDETIKVYETKNEVHVKIVTK
jgi:DnaJ-class molecular chaperone